MPPKKSASGTGPVSTRKSLKIVAEAFDKNINDLKAIKKAAKNKRARTRQGNRMTVDGAIRRLETLKKQSYLCPQGFYLVFE